MKKISIIALSCIVTINSWGQSAITSKPGNGVKMDGYTYKTVILGNGQEWMAENLRTSVYANGERIYSTYNTPTPNDETPLWRYPDDKKENEAKYGKLYNFYVFTDYKNVCPTGWSVPTPDDYENLVSYLSPKTHILLQDTEPSKAKKAVALALKSTEKSGWTNEDGKATNSSGFNSFCSGIYWSYLFEYTQTSAAYWTRFLYESETGDSDGMGFFIVNDGNIFLSNAPTTDGLSIRCIKN